LTLSAHFESFLLLPALLGAGILLSAAPEFDFVHFVTIAPDSSRTTCAIVEAENETVGERRTTRAARGGTMNTKRHHVVVIGGGFGGLKTAKAFKKADVDVTLVDKQNHHLFWPLLYQVATAGLSPGDIAAPLRAIFARQKNVSVLMADVVDIDPDEQTVHLADGEEIRYDSLVVAAGFQYHYFGNEAWGEHALNLQGVDRALAIREQILSSYEAAERETDPERQQALLTFVVVGAGPTGVELAGSIAELARHSLKDDFRRIDPTQTKVLLVEALDRVMPAFPKKLSAKALRSLEKLGVSVRLNTKLLDVVEDHVLVESDGERERIDTETVLWAAGVKASPLGEVLHRRTGVELDRGGHVKVAGDLSIPGYPNIYVIGDMSYFEQDGKPLPGLAQVAMQGGTHAAKQILRRLNGEEPEPFHYFDRGNMATIGRAAAVADIRGLLLDGYLAWLMWLTIHLMFLVGFQNRLSVFTQWAWSYFTYGRGVRIIINRGQRASEQAERTLAMRESSGPTA
jgi:NADH:ubiquinone reductase (H+-translocating)